jgi:hypothetical protein
VLCTGGSIGPDASHRVPRPRVARAPHVRATQYASGALDVFFSALRNLRLFGRVRAQAYGTTCRSGIAAARRHIALDPMNDLGQVGTTARAHTSSITLHVQFDYFAADSSNITTAGAASPLSEVALGFDTPVGGGWPTASSRASEGARQPLRLELGAQSAPKWGVGHALTAPSSPLRCRHGARDGLRLCGLDGLRPRPRRGRLRRLLQPLHHPSRSIFAR